MKRFRSWMGGLARRGIIMLGTVQRKRLRAVRIVGITGSAGKTTAKDLSLAVLSSRLHGKANRFTHNRPVQIAQMLLCSSPKDDFLVQEISVEALGYADQQIALLRPQIGVVTCVGLDHYAAFRSLESVAKEKGKLISSLPAEGWAILNADDPLVLDMRRNTKARVITYGLSSTADFRAEDICSDWPNRLSFTARFGPTAARVQSQLLGAHWTSSILAALAVGHAFDIPLDVAAEAISKVPPVNGRMSPVILPGPITFVRDDVKAPLWSISHALAFVRTAKATRKIIVIGTLSDVPGNTSRKYQRVAREAIAAADIACFVGPQSHLVEKVKKEAEPDRLLTFPVLTEVHAYLQKTLMPGDLVFLKGSILADHLARLVLAREAPITCWREKCLYEYACAGCRHLRAQVPRSDVSGQVLAKTRGPHESRFSLFKTLRRHHHQSQCHPH